MGLLDTALPGDPTISIFFALCRHALLKSASIIALANLVKGLASEEFAFRRHSLLKEISIIALANLVKGLASKEFAFRRHSLLK
jgi:hypothetical protein